MEGYHVERLLVLLEKLIATQVEANAIARERLEKGEWIEAAFAALVPALTEYLGRDKFADAVLATTQTWGRHPEGWNLPCDCEYCCDWLKAIWEDGDREMEGAARLVVKPPTVAGDDR